MNNTLFVLLDGAEDDPNPIMGGRKPIDVADMPFLRSISVHNIYTTGREYTHIFLNEFLTGYPPIMSRAALEALGLGMSIKDPKRTAYRLSPAKIENGMINWQYNSSGFSNKLMRSIMSHMDILHPYNPEIRFFVNGRAIITMEYEDIPDLPSPPVDSLFKAIPGALGELVMSVADDMGGITGYPWGCGKYGYQYNPLSEIKNMIAVSNSPTQLGICASLGYKIYLIDELDNRFPVAKNALKYGDVLIHIDEIDEYSHQKDPIKKKWILEHTDHMMSKYFGDVKNIVYFVDHGTSCITGRHIPINVPIWTNIDTNLHDGSVIQLGSVISTLFKDRV